MGGLCPQEAHTWPVLWDKVMSGECSQVAQRSVPPEVTVQMRTCYLRADNTWSSLLEPGHKTPKESSESLWTLRSPSVQGTEAHSHQVTAWSCPLHPSSGNRRLRGQLLPSPPSPTAQEFLMHFLNKKKNSGTSPLACPSICTPVLASCDCAHRPPSCHAENKTPTITGDTM